MVLLALSSKGLKEALSLSTRGGIAAVWCSLDAISEEEFLALKFPTLTRFNYSISHAEKDVIAGAMDTIEEHHPGHRIWVEANV